MRDILGHGELPAFFSRRALIYSFIPPLLSLRASEAYEAQGLTVSPSGPISRRLPAQPSKSGFLHDPTFRGLIFCRSLPFSIFDHSSARYRGNSQIAYQGAGN
jgi:hypothetical protein